MLFPIPCTRHYYNIQNVNIYQAATLLGSGTLQPHNENYQQQSTTAPPPQKKTKTKRKKERKKGNMFKATFICSDIVMPMNFL